MEDNEGDYTIVEDFLTEQILNPDIIHVETYQAAVNLLQEKDGSFDVILLDLRLADNNGRELIDDMLRVAPETPVIIMTGYSDINFSIKSISAGIMDYLLKDEMTAAALYKSIIYSIQLKKNISELKVSQKQYSDLFQRSPQPMCLYEMNTFRFLRVNKAAMQHYGYSLDEFLGMTLLDLVPAEDKQLAVDTIDAQKRVLNETYAGKSRNFKKNGEIIEVETFSTPIIISDSLCTLVIAIDVTQKNQYEHNIIKAIIKTQEDERYEIGGELHDNVCQILATGKMVLEMLKNSLAPVAKNEFEQCGGYINMALIEIRNLSHRLAPSFFEDSRLEEAISRLFATFDAEKKLAHTLYYDKQIDKYEISLEIQLNLYRILQEQLRNILKHAKATEVNVRLEIAENILQMKVADNGVGFNVKEARAGIGMANMKRRAELFSGTCEVISSPGNGCEIIISLPLSLNIQSPG